MRAIHLLALLAVNAIPAAGWFIEGWSAGTTLVVYWFENVAVCLFVAARIIATRRASPRRGHFKYQAPKSAGRSSQTSFLSGFLVTSLVFSAAHGVFLGLILFMLAHNGQDHLAGVAWHQVRNGCIGVLVILAIEFAVDLPALRRWTFWQVEQIANRSLGRIVVVHLTLVLGMFGAVMTDASALFGVFIVLKTLNALSMALPQWEPRTAPRWLSRKFADAWDEERANEAARRVENEQPWTGAKNA